MLAVIQIDSQCLIFGSHTLPGAILALPVCSDVDYGLLSTAGCECACVYGHVVWWVCQSNGSHYVTSPPSANPPTGACCTSSVQAALEPEEPIRTRHVVWSGEINHVTAYNAEASIGRHTLESS